MKSVLYTQVSGCLNYIVLSEIDEGSTPCLSHCEILLKSAQLIQIKQLARNPSKANNFSPDWNLFCYTRK